MGGNTAAYTGKRRSWLTENEKGTDEPTDTPSYEVNSAHLIWILNNQREQMERNRKRKKKKERAEEKKKVRKKGQKEKR